MARIRSVHPSLFTDEAWVSCSPLARILYIGLWTDADDQGLFEWKPLQIKMRLLPGDAGDVAALLSELEGVDLIKGYSADGKRFGAIANFRKFQRPQKPNAIHPLAENIAEYVGLSVSDKEPVEDHSTTAHVIAPQMEDVGEDEGRKKKPVGSAEPMPTADPWLKDINFAKAWDACTEMGRKRSSRKKAWPEWRAALKRETGPVLAAAMARYVAGDEDAKRTGGPGFHQWLKDGRYEHWTDDGPATGGEAPPTFNAPQVRASLVKATDEDFVVRYVDHYCRWEPNGRRLEAKTPGIAAALTGKLAEWAKRNEVTIAVAAANDTPKPDLFAEGAAA